jgi:hypothetical protein
MSCSGPRLSMMPGELWDLIMRVITWGAAEGAAGAPRD